MLMEECFKNNLEFVYIHTLDMKIGLNEAQAQGIEKCLNSLTHMDLYGRNGEGLWSVKLMNHPHNLVLNRQDGDVVISSLIFFIDEFCINMFLLRNLWNDGEENLAALSRGLLN